MARGYVTVATEAYRSAATINHLATITVLVVAIDGARTATNDAVCALVATATEVPRDEKVVPTAMLEDERCLNSMCAACVALCKISLLATLGNGLLLSTVEWSREFLVELHELDAAPERAPCHSSIAFLVEVDSRIYGIPIGLARNAADDSTRVVPFRAIRRELVRHRMTDSRGVLAEA